MKQGEGKRKTKKKDKEKIPKKVVARRRMKAQAARRRAGTPGRGEFPPLVRTLPKLDLSYPSARGYLLQGAEHQVAFLEFDANSFVPPHCHRAQWEIVVDGEVDLRIADDWRTYQRGDAFWIPAGVEHEGLIKKGYRSIILFDQKDRYGTKP